jgi:outer membrane protein assembly factor BamA
MENEFLLNDEVYGSNGGNLLGFGTDLLWDSRDNIFFPNSGTYQYFKAVIYPGIGEYSFALFELDVKHFRSFKPDHVFAGNFFFQAATGETPFYKMPALGGAKRMRGYFFGRYRDNIYMMLQLEYRQYFWKRFGFVVFAGAGNVSDEIMTYSFNTMKYSYGGGLRFMFNKKQKVNLRMDVGFGPGGFHGIYFGIEEAF